jgi:hypothetical protein
MRPVQFSEEFGRPARSNPSGVRERRTRKGRLVPKYEGIDTINEAASCVQVQGRSRRPDRSADRVVDVELA